MGLRIEELTFDEEDRQRFARRLRGCLDALAEVLARPGFGIGEPTIGAELEVNLVDDVSGAHFTADRGVIRSRDALVPIMMTTDLGIARSDCLFYLVRAR